jgi:hypothetical protein
LSGDKWEGSVKRSTLQLKSGYVLRGKLGFAKRKC